MELDFAEFDRLLTDLSQIIEDLTENEQRYRLKEEGWFEVYFSSELSIEDKKWCAENLQGDFRIFSHSCFCERNEDAVMFALRYA